MRFGDNTLSDCTNHDDIEEKCYWRDKKCRLDGKGVGDGIESQCR